MQVCNQTKKMPFSLRILGTRRCPGCAGEDKGIWEELGNSPLLAMQQFQWVSGDLRIWTCNIVNVGLLRRKLQRDKEVLALRRWYSIWHYTFFFIRSRFFRAVDSVFSKNLKATMLRTVSTCSYFHAHQHASRWRNWFILRSDQILISFQRHRK